jgi:hypothetical protein
VPFDDLRRVLAQAGFSTATTRPPGSHGRTEAVAIRAATLAEHSNLRTIPVGPAERCPEPLAFLDGVQHHQVVGYAGTFPLVAGIAAAAVRQRRDRRLATLHEVRRRLVIGREAALARIPEWLSSYQPVVLEDDPEEHPVREIDRAVAKLDDARTALEVEAGRAFRRDSDDWLIVDGSLAESTDFAEDPRMIGVSKSHATLPFRGEELDQYLRMPVGHRSSVFEPASRRFAPVYAWGLRLWPWEGRDLLFGLVRVEAARRPETLALADRWSRWIMAERAPVSAPDARWDRLLYGIHNVEDYLRARLAVR